MPADQISKLYAGRKLSEGYPDLVRLGHEYFSRNQGARPDNADTVRRWMGYIGRLVDLASIRDTLVIGCGPAPATLRALLDDGFNAVGVEPISDAVCAGGEYMGAAERVLEGEAERLPVPDQSQDLLFCESVLEHVDSPNKSLDEFYRVLRPGGLVLITTTNRHKFSLTGSNGEFEVPFYNWFPRLVKECYVFDQLHYRPALANYTSRPAVHWYSYSDLCQLGRQAGFAYFYTFLDMLEPDDPVVARSRFRRFVLKKLKYNPWLRALAITQLAGMILMRKRR